MMARFVPSESTFTYFDATKAYALKHGKPIAFYSDKHGVFRVNAKDPKAGDQKTQFGRALQEVLPHFATPRTSKLHLRKIQSKMQSHYPLKKIFMKWS